MEIKLTDRATECNKKIKDMLDEIKDYEMIAQCVRVLSTVEANPEKYSYTDDDYQKVINKFKNLCAKHEINIPDFIEWGSIEIT